MVTTTGLLAYYKCDDNAANTTVTDSTGNGNDGTATTNTNNLYDATAKIGSSFDFSASEKVPLTNMLSGEAEFSYCAWVQTNALGAYRRVISKDNNAVSYNILLRMTNGNKFQGSVNNGAGDTYITGSTTITTGTWYFVAVTYSSGHLNLYVNGSSDATEVTTATGNLRTASDILTMASYRDATGQWDGLIDEVSVWNRALTSTDITDLYNSGSGLSYPFSTVASPSALSLSTTDNEPSIIASNGQTGLNLSITLNLPLITGFDLPNIIGTKELRTDWPNIIGTDFGTTKTWETPMFLEPTEGTNVKSRYRVGM